MLGSLLASGYVLCNSALAKPNAEAALNLLKTGSERFVSGTSIHSNTSSARLILAGKEDQRKSA